MLCCSRPKAYDETVGRRDHIARVVALLRVLELAGGRGVSLRQVASHNRWPLSNLYRDLRTLEEAGYEIGHEDHRYTLAPSRRPSSSDVGSDEMLALFVARQLAAGFRPMDIGKALDRLWAKLSSRPGRSSALLPGGGPPWISIRPPLAIDYNDHRGILETFERSLRQRVAVRCRYAATSTGEITSRVIEPGELHWDPGLEAWYLIAYCRLRSDLRVFAIHRFRAAQLIDEAIGPRRGVSSRAALRHAFRVWRSNSVETVRVWFAPRVAQEVRERSWHASQRVESESDGSCVLQLEVAGTPEIERWICGFGGDARVLEPERMAVAVRAAHEAALTPLERSRKKRLTL